MKLKLICGAIVVTICVISLVVFYPQFTAIADRDFPYEGDEPDMPGFLQTGTSKEEFMLLRSEYVGLKRGVGKDEPVDPHLRQSAIAKMEEQQAGLAGRPESSETVSLLAPWTPIGPAPIPNGQTSSVSTAVSGRVIAIAVHPTNPNIVYVGTAQGGLYRSTDGGTNWTSLLDSALSLAIGAVAIAPSQPETVYVGTGEGNFSADSFFGVGVYRIDNASGASPTITGPLNKNTSAADIFTGRSISKIAVHPTDPATIFVSSTTGLGGIGGFNTPIVLTPNVGVYRSTNATAASPTFTQIGPLPAPNNNFSVHDIVIDPQNPNLMVAVLVASGGGIYLSTNALAASPTFTNTQTFTGGTSTLNTEFAIQHAQAGGNPTIYAATGNGGGRVLRSTDGGLTWPQQISNSFCGGQCFYDIAIAVDPTDPAKVYLGGDPTLIFGFSTNSAVSFTPSVSGLHSDSHAITVAPSLPSTIYFGCDGGIYKSTNSGVSWTSLNNTQFSATQFMSIAVHPTDPNFSIGGTQDNGTNFYQPNATWTRADFGDGGYAAIDQNAADTTNVRMYHTYFNNGSLQGYATVSSTASASDGNWTFRGCNGAGATANGITCSGSTLFYAPVELGPGNPNTVYFGTDRLYRSTDAGLNNTPASQNPITAGDPISAIGISPQNDSVRIVGLSGGGIWGTTTGSATLTNLDTGGAVPNSFIARAVIDPNNVNTAYVTLSAFGVNNVFRTTNFNNATPTWTAIVGSGGTALPQVPVSAFLVDPTSSTTLYAGTDIGVYTSTDSGATWNPFGTGLPRVAVFDMAITANPNRKMRIATHGRGMWEMSLGGGGTIPVTVQTNPVGRSFTVDGTPFTTTQVFNWTPGSAHTIATTSPQAGAAGTQFVFSNWSDAGALSHSVSPSVTTVYTANFTTQFQLTMAAGAGGTVSPASGFFNSGQGVNISATPNAGFNFTGWTGTGSGSFTGATNAVQITMNAPISETASFAPIGCNYSLNPTSQNFSKSGGSSSVQVTTQAGCGWTAVSNSFANLDGLVDGLTMFSLPPRVDVFATRGETDRDTPVALMSPAEPAATFPGTGVGAIPDGLSGTPPAYGPALVVNFAVSGITAPVTNVSLDVTLTHTWVGDVDMILTAPGGSPSIPVVSRIGVTVDGDFGDSSNYGGTYAFSDAAAGTNIWTVATNGSCTTDCIVTPGTYRTTAPGQTGQVIPAPVTNLTATFTGLTTAQANGTWTLRVRDAGAVDTGTVTAANLTIVGTAGGGNWINITSGASGTGSGPVNYTVAANTTGSPRSGTMTIAGQTFTVNQSNTLGRKQSDFDGDGKSDIVVFRESEGNWYFLNSLGNTFGGVHFGIVGDRIVPGDYDGDGKTDFAVWRPSSGTWFILNSTGGFIGVPFGLSTDLPAQGDYDNDGKTDIAVWRPSNGTWFLQQSTAGFAAVQFGASGDRPVPGDYDGDGKTDQAVFRPSEGNWYLLQSTAGFGGIHFGIPTDKVVPADFDGDGKTDVAVFRVDGTGQGVWFLLQSTAGFAVIPFGTTNDIPAPGDFDGDSKADTTVFRPSNGIWFSQQTTSGFVATQFGQNGDKPVPAGYVPVQ